MTVLCGGRVADNRQGVHGDAFATAYCYYRLVLQGQSGYKFANHIVNFKAANGIFPSTKWLKSFVSEEDARFICVVQVRIRCPKAASIFRVGH